MHFETKLPLCCTAEKAGQQLPEGGAPPTVALGTAVVAPGAAEVRGVPGTAATTGQPSVAATRALRRSAPSEGVSGSALPMFMAKQHSGGDIYCLSKADL